MTGKTIVRVGFGLLDPRVTKEIVIIISIDDIYVFKIVVRIHFIYWYCSLEKIALPVPEVV